MATGPGLSNPKRASAREPLLLLLPVVALIAAGLWFTQHQKQQYVDTHGPMRLKIVKVERETLTPLEAARGYDTKVGVTIRQLGAWPLPLGLMGMDTTLTPDIHIQSRDAPEKPVSAVAAPFEISPVEVSNHRWFYTAGKGIFHLLLAGSRIPSNSSDLVLSGKIRGDTDCLVRRRDFHQDGQTTVLANGISVGYILVSVRDDPASFAFVVRRAGENAPIPEVSHDTSLSIVKSQVIHMAPLDGKMGVYNDSMDTFVQVLLHADEPAFFRRTDADRWKCGPATLVDGKDHTIKVAIPDNLLRFRGVDANGLEPGGGQVGRDYWLTCRVTMSLVPQNIDRVTFVTWVSMDDKWMLPISVTLRDRTHPNLPPSSLLLKSVAVSRHGDEVAIHAAVKYRGNKTVLCTHIPYEFDDPIYREMMPPEPEAVHLLSDWSQHIQDEDGTDYWTTLSPPNGYKPMVSNDSATCDASGNCDVVYNVNLKDLPLGAAGLTLKAEIGLEGEEFIPISAVVREVGQTKR